jgi:methionyl aminopeptidase
MNDENFEKDYKEAKKVSDLILDFSKKLVVENAKIIEIAEKIENKINLFGAKPAWPVNISINSIAAHYTPTSDDKTILKEGDLVKVDIGTQVNGVAHDRAFTICIGSKSHLMIEAAEKALEEAMKILKPGVKVCELSEVIENTVKEFGFNTIKNLSGHAIERYEQHAQPSIPNAKNNIQTEIKEGQLIAIEVFVTNGDGWVIDSGQDLIFKYVKDKPVRMKEARRILEIAKTEFNKLPFAKRWIKEIPSIKFDLAIKELLDSGCIRGYCPLKEQSNGLVAVAEETKLVK